MLSIMDRDIKIRESKEGVWEDFLAKSYAATTQAIGYLSTWGGAKFSSVHLFAKEDEIIATYYKHNPDIVEYVIGAVWHPEEKRFSFHS